MNQKNLYLFFVVCILSAYGGFAQSQSKALETAQKYIQAHHASWNLTQSDITNWVVTDQYTSKHNGLTHIYLRQQHANIPLPQANLSLHVMPNGTVLNPNCRFISNLSQRINTTQPSLSPNQAISKAAENCKLQSNDVIKLISSNLQTNEYLFSKGGISQNDIPVKLVYDVSKEQDIRLAWQVVIYELSSQHWWEMRVDATNGQILSKTDWVIHDHWGSPAVDDECIELEAHPTHPEHAHVHEAHKTMAPDSYNVYPMPVESPNHGSRAIIVDPADATASPFGWHDDNGVTGAEYTITRGNNVWAREDRDANNSGGYSPDAGASLDFDYPLDLNQSPQTYEDAAITNLFYWNNLIHDVWYHYGFDEVSGNFQENNYGNGGQGGDYVFADAQDGGGTNNANFATPGDGNNPRMQMFLWTAGGATANYLTVNSPGSISGSYSATGATYGPGLPATPITADVVLVDDGSAAPTEACNALVNGADVNGKIALIDRGNCTFVNKVLNAQNAGAVAVIMVNNVAGAPITMGGTDNSITIPSIMISQADGNLIKAQLPNVNATISNVGGSNERDGDFDNGIIVHEYGHGISTRLTGGPSTSCLGSDEQMGEGWSDYFGLVMTVEAGDQGADVRGIGTYPTGQAVNGTGIRTYPYSTDMNVNPHTYGDIGGESIPHGVGSVWCAMIWDLYWKLVEEYGWDSDIYNGTGGNNIAMQLVIDGCKIQGCDPGFIDGRDAILAADQANNGGANQCLIWEVFARRGLGYSASQGSVFSTTDGNEGFDMPPSCLIPTAIPSTDFEVDYTTTCDGLVYFTDLSTEFPNAWQWDFGDGNTSTQQNPSHTYTAPGTYTVTLTSSNLLGSDGETKTSYIVVDFPTDPSVVDGEGCSGTAIVLSAAGSGQINWYDANGNSLSFGNTFLTPTLTSTTTYYVEDEQLSPAQSVGPTNPSFGGGGYHGNASTQFLEFTVHKRLLLRSAWVDADGAGNRTFTLWDNTGQVLDNITINIPGGTSRIDFDLELTPGQYRIGGTQMDLYRNNNSPSYPYSIQDFIEITGSSAGPDYYYYIYDWEVREPSCISQQVPVTATVLPAPTADFSVTNAGATYTFNDNSSGATSWNWDFGDGNTSTAQNPTHGYAQVGSYQVTLTVSDGTCENTTTQTLEVSVASAVEDELPNASMNLYPNPSGGTFMLDIIPDAPSDVKIQIFSTLGKQVYSYNEANSTNFRKQIALSDLTEGTYFVKVTVGEFTAYRKYLLVR